MIQYTDLESQLDIRDVIFAYAAIQRRNLDKANLGRHSFEFRFTRLDTRLVNSVSCEQLFHAAIPSATQFRLKCIY